MLTFKPSLYSEFHCIDYKISWENTGAFSQMYLKYFCSNSWLTDTFINITFWLVDDLALPTATQVKRVNDTLVTQSLSLIKAVNLVEANPPLTWHLLQRNTEEEQFGNPTLQTHHQLPTPQTSQQNKGWEEHADWVSGPQVQRRACFQPKLHWSQGNKTNCF